MSDPSPVPPAPEPGVFRCVHGVWDAGTARIMMVGDLDLAAAAYARDTIRRAQDEAGDVVCDLGYVSFLDLAGLQVLVEAAAYARQQNTRLTVANSPPLLPRILRLFRAQGLTELEAHLAPAAPLTRDQRTAPDEQNQLRRALRQTRDRESSTHSRRRLRDH